jgi:AraC-like DNA-binding protein
MHRSATSVVHRWFYKFKFRASCNWRMRRKLSSWLLSIIAPLHIIQRLAGPGCQDRSHPERAFLCLPDATSKKVLSIEELTDDAHPSPRQFSRAFRTKTGQSSAKGDGKPALKWHGDDGVAPLHDRRGSQRNRLRTGSTCRTSSCEPSASRYR